MNSATDVAWTAGLGWAVGLVIATIMGSSCVSIDPGHCRHRDGDASCGGDTPYCNECHSSEANSGCVEEKPIDDCYFGGDAPFASDTPADTGSSTDVMNADDANDDGGGDDSMPTTDAEECSDDNACTGLTPLCVDGTCSACGDAGGDSFCEARDESLPNCSALGGCTECAADDVSSCEDESQYCDATGACGGCFEHAQCGDAGCDLVTGACLNPRLAYWLQTPLCDTEMFYGNEDEPYCDVDSVQENLDDFGSITLHLVGGTYDVSLAVNSANTLVVVADEPSILGDTGALDVSANGRVFVQGTRLTSLSGPTIACGGQGTVWVRGSEIVGGVAAGVDANTCDITIEQTLIGDNGAQGVVSINSDVVVLSTAVLNNAGGGLEVNGGSLLLSHATVANNGRSNVNCGGGPATVRNSVVMQSTGASFAGCGDMNIRKSVVDVQRLANAEAGVRHAAFSADFFVSLRGTDPHATRHAPFGSVATWEVGDPNVDIDGDALATAVGALNWAGCDLP